MAGTSPGATHCSSGYGVNVARGEDDVLFLAMAVALDRIQHDEDRPR